MIAGSAVIASTHVDSHGEGLTKEALVSMAEALNREYVTIETQHDPRLPPRGRVVSARVVESDDGEWLLKGELEIWGEGDRPESLSGDGRSIRTNIEVRETFDVHFDRSFLTSEGKAFVHNLARLSSPSAEPIQDVKKAAADLHASNCRWRFRSGRNRERFRREDRGGHL